MNLDSMDLRILDQLQQDGAISNVELAKRVCLSPSPCLARVKAMESAGVIHRYVALVSAAALGLGLTVFISISLKAQSKASLAEFELAKEARAFAAEELAELKAITAAVHAKVHGSQ